MLFMIVKKGNKWLQRDFEAQLRKRLSTDHIADLHQMTDFVGREQFVDNMLIRGEIEEAGYKDLQVQKDIECEKKKALTVESNLKTKLEKEEAALAAAMGI